MKNLLLLFFTTLIIQTTINAQFTIIQTSTGKYLNDVHFLDPQTGYAVGEDGAMVKTTDGGDNWTTLNLNTSENLLKVQFVNANLGFAISDSVFFKTTDGGQSFSSTTFSQTLRDLHFISATEGKIVGYEGGGIILSTTDGGTTFTPQTIGVSWYAWDTLQGIGVGNYYTLDCIDYSNSQWEIGGSNYDYNGGDYTFAFYSTNGTSWTERYLDLNLAYGDTDASILDVKTINGDVYHLKKPGMNLTYLYKNDWAELWASNVVFFNKINEFGILNNDIILIPTNGKLRIYDVNNGGGGSVVEQNVGGITLTGGVGMVNTTIGFFTGTGGKLMKYTDLASSTKLVEDLNIKIYPNPADDFLMIETNENFDAIDIIDQNGRVLSSTVNSTTVNISTLAKGVYFIKMTRGEREITKRFLKK